MADPKDVQAKLTASKIQKLNKYVAEMKGRLDSNMIGSKYAGTPEQYKRFLKREIETHTKKIQDLSK